MVDTNIIDKLSLIYKFLSNNSLVFLVILLIVAILLDYLYGKNKLETKILYIIILGLIIVYGLFDFYKPLFNIIDVYITNIFKLAYFPSIIEYFSMILITIILQIISVKRLNKIHKNVNLWVGFIIEVLFIINIVAMKNITVDLYKITSIYENDLLLSIFQITSIIFMIWVVINIIIYMIKLFIVNRIEIPKLNDDYE